MTQTKIHKIGLALAFSPRMEAIMAEAVRLMHLYNSFLVLVHVGEKTVEAEEKVISLITTHKLEKERIKILWKKGDPVESILKVCHEEHVDLLIAGALKKENLMQHYLGSVARKILRKANCSVLMLTNPDAQPKPFSNIVVNAEDSAYVHEALSMACSIAQHDKAAWVHIVREVKLYGLSMASVDDCTEEEYNEVRNGLLKNEIENVEKLLVKIPHDGLRTNIKLLSGKSGFELSKFAQRKQADLLVVGAAPRRFFLFDRVFTHDHEYIFQDLPCNLLIVNPTNRKEASNG
jgi:nucleotide-binding universal stress UspA family protein